MRVHRVLEGRYFVDAAGRQECLRLRHPRRATGAKYPDAKPLKGFGGAGVLEVVKNFDGDTYRAVYAVKFAEMIYVLHVFKKKSKRGAKTPKADIDLIKSRLKDAEEKYTARTGSKKTA